MSKRYEFGRKTREGLGDWFRNGSGSFQLGKGVSVESVENGGFWLLMPPGPDLDLHEMYLAQLEHIRATMEDKPMPVHDLDLIATGWPDGTKPPVIKCQGGVDPRPSAEKLAKLIRERDEAQHDLAVANKEIELMLANVDQNKKLKQEVERLQAMLADGPDHNWTKSGIKRIMKERDDANEKLEKIKVLLHGLPF